MSINPVQKVLISFLLAKKVTDLKKYFDFSNVFSKKSIAVPPYCLYINKYAIDLELNKQPPYKLIYDVSLIELKIFKT